MGHMINGIIFDVDGVILDSMEMWDLAPSWYLHKMNMKAEDGLGKKMFEMTMHEGAEYLRSVYLPDLSVDEVLKGVKLTISDYYQKEVQLKAGIKDVLCFLKNKKIPMTIATSTERTSIVNAFRRLEIYDFFQHIFTCEEVGTGKNRPDIYLKAQNYMKTEIVDTLVIEDSYFAMQTAKEAGFPVLGIFDSTCEPDQEKIMDLADYYCKELNVEEVKRLCIQH